MTGMTKAERAELSMLIRKREKVMRSMAVERSAELLAQFDAQSARIYHYDEDEVWSKVFKEAEAAVAAANEAIAARCVERGIPPEFAPQVGVGWAGRGHNAVASRRQELRRAAKSRIEQIEADAITKIERASLMAQTEIIASGLESEAAQRFLKSMPAIEMLMPSVDVMEVERLIAVERSKRPQVQYYN